MHCSFAIVPCFAVDIVIFRWSTHHSPRWQDTSSSPVLPAPWWCPAGPLGAGRRGWEKDSHVGRSRETGRVWKKDSVSAESDSAERRGRNGQWESRPANAKGKRNGDEKIGRGQTIVIKLSMRSRRSCKALIRFNHHEIRALRRSTGQRQHRCRHACCLSAWSREH